MGRPVVHWEIWAKDAKKLQDFYAKLFEWTINTNNPINYGLVQTGGPESGVQRGINGGIFKPEKADLPQRLTFYVEVEDVQKYLDKATQLGGKTLVPPTSIPGIGTWALFSDPEGVCIGLFKP